MALFTLCCIVGLDLSNQSVFELHATNNVLTGTHGASMHALQGKASVTHDCAWPESYTARQLYQRHRAELHCTVNYLHVRHGV